MHINHKLYRGSFVPSWINRDNLFTIVALSLAVMFGWGFFSVAGIPPTNVKDYWQLLVVFMFFLIIPFAKKLDFFQLLSFEAKISELRKDIGDTREKVSDVREDVRYLISQQNALSASVQSINSQAVTVNNYERPPPELLASATAELADVQPVDPFPADPLLAGLSPEDKLLSAIFGKREPSDPASSDSAKSLRDLFVDIEDINQVRRINVSEQVAILRIRVERELKRLLKPHAESLAIGSRIVRRLSMSYRDMVTAAIKIYPDLNGQRDSFDVFFRIANAAVHADEVPMSDLETAVYLGERLLGLLTKLEAPHPEDPQLPF